MLQSKNYTVFATHKTMDCLFLFPLQPFSSLHNIIGFWGQIAMLQLAVVGG